VGGACCGMVGDHGHEETAEQVRWRSHHGVARAGGEMLKHHRDLSSSRCGEVDRTSPRRDWTIADWTETTRRRKQSWRTGTDRTK